MVNQQHIEYFKNRRIIAVYQGNIGSDDPVKISFGHRNNDVLKVRPSELRQLHEEGKIDTANAWILQDMCSHPLL